MSNRLKKIGIKQAIRLEWMDYTLQLLLSGMTEAEVRQELTNYLEDKKMSGGVGARGEKTYTMAINMLMQSWVTPDEELQDLRNACLEYAQEHPNAVMSLHWVMIGTAYPFWQHLASVVGRLFEFQEIVQKQQILNRLKESFGDRQTVARNARYAIRSYVAWNVIADVDQRGYYQKTAATTICDPYLISLFYESMLLNTEEYRLSYTNMLSAHSMFPFEFTKLSAVHINKINPRLRILTAGYSDTVFSVG